MHNSDTSMGVDSSLFFSFALVNRHVIVILEPFICRIHAGQPGEPWVEWCMLFWWWIGYASQLTQFGQAVDWQCIIFMWYQSWFITVSISSHRIFTCILFQIIADGQQVIFVQGIAAPFPFYWMYHIYWWVWIGLPFHHILPILPSALNFVSALEDGDMDQDHVSYPQGHCLAMSVIILLMMAVLPLAETDQPSCGPT